MIVNQYGREVRDTHEPVRDPEQVADALTGTLARGLTWLYDVEQPPETIPPNHHHGPTLLAPLVGRSVSFIPDVNGSPVVVVESTEYDTDNGARPPRHGLAPGELEAVTRVITGVFNRAVRGTWNGHPGVGGSIHLVDPAHPSLRAAVAYYMAGCPVHRTVFCGGWQASPGQEDCRWNQDARDRVVAP